jgi:hypothetical protein
VKLSPLAGSPNHQASRHAVVRDGTAKGQGAGSSDKSEKGNQGGAGKGNQANNQQGGRQSQGQGQGSAQGNSGSGRNQQADGSKQNEGRPGQQNPGGKDEQNQAPGNQQDQNQPGQPGQEKSQDAEEKRNKPEGQADEDQGGNQPDQAPGAGPSTSTPTPPPPPPLSPALSKLFEILKWVVFALVALVVGFIVLRALLRFLSNFTDWAKRLLAALQGLWDALFGWIWRDSFSEEKKAEPVAPARPPRPFASYRNPFWDGGSNQTSPEALVRYSFEALEAWAREHALPRGAEETPLEFGLRLGEEVPGLAEQARGLTVLYARAAYARGRLPVSCVDSVRQFWQRLEEIQEAPLSA